MLPEELRQNANCASQNNHFSPPFFFFPTPDAVLRGGGKCQARVLLCPRHAPGKPGLSGLGVASCSSLVSLVLLTLQLSTYNVRRIFAQTVLCSCFIRAKPGNLATVTELVRAGEGCFGVVPLHTQRDDAPTFARGLGGRLAAVSVGLKERSYFYGQGKMRNGTCLGGREKPGSAFMDAVCSRCVVCKLYLLITQVAELHLTCSFGNVLALREG